MFFFEIIILPMTGGLKIISENIRLLSEKFCPEAAMKKKYIWPLLALLLTGCVSYEYHGIKEPPTTEVTVYADGQSIAAKYILLGTATVSGNYPNVSYQTLLKKLQTEAMKNGANAVIISDDRIVPGKTQEGQPLFYTAFDYDSMESYWQLLYQDVDWYFAGKNQIFTLTTYKRVIRADFVKFSKSTEKSSHIF